MSTPLYVLLLSAAVHIDGSFALNIWSKIHGFEVETPYEVRSIDTEGPRLVAAAAIVSNPWFGGEGIEHTSADIIDQVRSLGEKLAAEVVKVANASTEITGQGKAAVVGMRGTVEHAAALIHANCFDSHFRKLIQSRSGLPLTIVQGEPGSPVQIPLNHKRDKRQQFIFPTVQVSIDDAPGPDEIVVAIGAAIGGLPFDRVLDRLEEKSKKIHQLHATEIGG